MEIHKIQVGKLIAEASSFRVYLGKRAGVQDVILKVAKTFEDNSWLATEASWFNILRIFSDKINWLEDEMNRNKSHFDWLFAKIDESFMEPTQGDRRINVFAMPDIDLDGLVPLAKLRKGTEIDVRSSVWILGRFLKFYSMFELIATDSENQISNYPLFSPGNYLIGPGKHRLICYNFSGDEADVLATDYVKAIAKFILGWVVVEDNPSEQEYHKLLEDFSKNGRDNFREAHLQLYALAEAAWGLKYHPFTYRDRGTAIWKTMKEE